MSTARTPRRPATLVLAAAALLASAPADARAGDPPAGVGKPGAALDKVLHGEVLAADADTGVIEVLYDFSDEEQLADFVPYRPFKVDGLLEHGRRDGALRLKGTGGLAWKPILRRSLGMEFDARLVLPRDCGVFVAEDRESDDYTLFSIYDQYFQRKDNPGRAKTHMICRFFAGGKEFGGDLVFRYVALQTRPPITPGKAVKVKLGRDGIDDWMELDGVRLQGNEAQWTPLQGLRPGFYVIDSEASFGAIRIRGVADPKWLEAEGVDLSLPVAAAAARRGGTRTPGPADFAAREKLKGFAAGTETDRAVMAVIEDTGLLEDVRREAAQALRDAGDPALVRRCLPLLESADLLTRTLGEEVVTALVGRSFGFRPDDPEEKRRKAVRSLLEHIQRNPGKFP